MDYELSRLNPRSFEQLIQGIGAKVLGPGLIIFGDGPDGGREAALNARVPYPSDDEKWSGHIVLQAKFRQRPQGTEADGRWAIGRLRRELESYRRVDSPRELPDYLIFATNVTLSAVKDVGAKDQMFELARYSRLRGFDVWDYDKLRVYLDAYEELRRSFAAYVLPGDVLSETLNLMQGLKSERPDFDDAISRFLQKELLADQWANLEQAGRAADEQIPISRVFVDLPVSEERRPDPPVEGSVDDLIPGFVSEVVEMASQRLDAEALEAQRVDRKTQELDQGELEQVQLGNRLVLLGGPGQGKTTLGQFVCQIFRAGLLESRPPHSLSPEVRDALAVLKDHCDSSGLSLPGVRRFPLRIELSKFASSLGGSNGVNSLLEYLANLISFRISGDVTPSLMSSWLAQYPWLLVLDGLDEVPQSSNRGQVMAAIRDFWVETAEDNADCMVLATTRPQGYNEDFSPKYYRHTWLSPLSSTRALHYADLLLKVRFREQAERRDDIAHRLYRAASRAETARLMTSPLQVTIMATLLERMGQPPEGRWNLFSRYYDVIYDREVEREIPAASVLREFRPDINAIHQRVGLLLQVESEAADPGAPQMSREIFTEIVRQRLREEEHEVEDDLLVSQIIESAMHRLVFLVGVQVDQVGFEIRSLQEFMAAEALLDGKDEIVERRLRAIAPRAGWRNVFLFAAGRCFSDLQHLRDTIYTICVELNDDAAHPLASTIFPGSVLAIDLLADGVAYRQPRYERMLAREALRIVRRPPSSLNDQLAEVYQPSLRSTYEAELRAALGCEDFAAALAAWRTLAVLGSRGEEWAFELLKSRMPPPEHLGDVLAALAQSTASEWLSRELAELCAESAPGHSLSQPKAIHALGILEFTPRWYSAFFALVEGRRRRSPGGDFRFEGFSERELWAQVFQITDTWGPIESAIAAVEDEELERMPASWSVPRAMMRFAKRPTAASLAEQLEFIATSREDTEGWRGYAVNAGWPLGSLLISSGGLRNMAKTAQLARQGAFGDRQQWKDAERRWRSKRVRKDDLRHPDDWEYPFDARIAEFGFPMLAAKIGVGKSGRQAAEVLDWLREANDPTTRMLLVHILFLMLAEFEANDSGPPDLGASEVVEAVDKGGVAGQFAFPLSALDGLRWGANPEREFGFLEMLGNRSRGSEGSAEERGLSTELRHTLLAAWQANRGRTGIYRLLAIGWPTELGTESEAAALLEAEADAKTDAARAVLKLKLGEVPTEADWTALADSEEEYWLEKAVEILKSWPGMNSLEVSLSKLDTKLKPRHWRVRGELGSLAAEVSSRHASGLAEQERWSSLELFARAPLTISRASRMG